MTRPTKPKAPARKPVSPAATAELFRVRALLTGDEQRIVQARIDASGGEALLSGFLVNDNKVR